MHEWFHKYIFHERALIQAAILCTTICLCTVYIFRLSIDDVLIIPRQPPIVQEITDVLKEWHKMAKQLYLNGNMQIFNIIKNSILQLHTCRTTSITSLDLTVDGRRELKKQVAEIIDSGNKYV